MSSKPYFKFYPGDYLADTAHFTNAEHGAYFLLLLSYYHTRKPPPDDDKRLSLITKVSQKRWCQLRLTVSKMFHIKNGFWIHKRVEKEINEYEEYIGRKRAAGAKGAEKRWNDEGSADYGNAIALPLALPMALPFKKHGKSQVTSHKSEPKPITQELTSPQDFDETKNLSVVEAKEKTRAARLSVVSHPSEIEMIFAHWQTVTGKTRARLNDERKKILSQALGWGYSVEDLCRAVSGCQQTPFFQGKNDRGQTYNDIDHIFKKAKNIDMFIENFFSPPQPTDTKLDPFVEAKKRSRQNSMQRNSEVTVIEENNYHV